MTEQAELSDLLVDEQQLNEELLTETVAQYARIGKDSGDLIPTEEYKDLTTSEKTVVGLLAQKARFELDLSEKEWLSPSELSDLTGVKKGTLYRVVRDLVDEGIARDEDGEYMIPSVNVEQAKEFLEGD